MHLHVSVQFVLPTKSVSTQMARKGLLPGVLCHVSCEILGILGGEQTPHKGTLVDLSASSVRPRCSCSSFPRLLSPHWCCYWLLGENQILLKTETGVCKGEVDCALLNLDAGNARQDRSSRWSSRRWKGEGVDWLILHLLPGGALFDGNAKKRFLSTLIGQLTFLHLPLNYLFPCLV